MWKRVGKVVVSWEEKRWEAQCSWLLKRNLWIRVLADLLIGEEFFCFLTDTRCVNLHALPLCSLQYLVKLVMLVALYCMHLFIYHRGTTFSFTSISLLPRELVTALRISCPGWCVMVLLYAIHEVPNSFWRTVCLKPVVPGLRYSTSTSTMTQRKDRGAKEKE